MVPLIALARRAVSDLRAALLGPANSSTLELHEPRPTGPELVYDLKSADCNDEITECVRGLGQLPPRDPPYSGGIATFAVTANELSLESVGGSNEVSVRNLSLPRFRGQAKVSTEVGQAQVILKIDVPTNDFIDFAARHGIGFECDVSDPPFPGQTETVIPFSHPAELWSSATFSEVATSFGDERGLAEFRAWTPHDESWVRCQLAFVTRFSREVRLIVSYQGTPLLARESTD
jgi:hypothetical protein